METWKLLKIVCDSYSGDLNPDFTDDYIFMDFHKLGVKYDFLGATLSGEGILIGLETRTAKWISFS
jgi:hypothetical protein